MVLRLCIVSLIFWVEISKDFRIVRSIDMEIVLKPVTRKLVKNVTNIAQVSQLRMQIKSNILCMRSVTYDVGY